MNMASTLSKRDIDVLEKIKDPESDPSMAVLLDDKLPKDPNVRTKGEYDRVSQKERGVVLAMQQLEMEMAGPTPKSHSDLLREYRKCVDELDDLISANPVYASARNNRAQALRRLYGDGMLVDGVSEMGHGLIRDAGSDETTRASTTVLEDLDRAVSLLSPPSLFAAMSPLAAKTLSLAHTQRAAIYHMTSRLLATGTLQIPASRKEATWTALEFEGAASHDFALGGRYGNEIAKGLAVSTNPTAKLCGQIVQEMMKKEYGPGLA